ncbi:MAG: hypothetical protein HC913_17480, partial [Microscillaceae bacterium]|nr:hypothetical protein [Microscillaceae bacterium]
MHYYTQISKFLLSTAPGLLLLLLAVGGCAPTKLAVSRIDPQENVSASRMGLVYFLPKKYLEVEVSFLLLNHVRILGYRDKSRPERYESVEQAALVQNVRVAEKILPDVREAYWIRFDNARGASNNLETTFSLDEQGLLTALNISSEGKAGEFFSGVVEMGASVLRFGSTVAGAAAGLGIRGDEGTPAPDEVRYAIDSVVQTFTKLIAIDQPDTTITLRGRDFLPEVLEVPSLVIRVMGSPVSATQLASSLPSQGRSLPGIVYRSGFPIRTRIEVRGEDSPLIRNKGLQKQVLMDAPILYPQFGIYGLAQIQIQESGKQITGIEFQSGGGISKYSLDR